MIGMGGFNNLGMGLAKSTAQLAMDQATKARQKATAAAMPKMQAFGGSGIKQRFENVESRLEELEGGNQEPIQSVQPTQAFVVSGEVTSAQALDRNRVQNATL